MKSGLRRINLCRINIQHWGDPEMTKCSEREGAVKNRVETYLIGTTAYVKLDRMQMTSISGQ